MKYVSRRYFLKKTGLFSASIFSSPALISTIGSKEISLGKMEMDNSLSISTDFVSGGGSVSIMNRDPITFKIIPHNQRNGGWSQVWWYFQADGITSGTEITLLLDKGKPEIQGISPQAHFSYDQQDWGLTNRGKDRIIDREEFFVYKHVVRGKKIWFGYDLPYTPEHMDTQLLPQAYEDPTVDVFEFCKTTNKRSVKSLRFNCLGNPPKKYGIWLQARTHAFESGSSWVLHEFTDWLLSDDEVASSLRQIADITVVPIVDVDAVVEGRTGKLQAPHDHNRGWDQTPGHWPQTLVTKSTINELSKENMIDMFIDFHGPGNESHPYFIIPESESLPHENQRKNRSSFFECLKAKPLDEEATQTQSMTQFYYSARPWDRIAKGNSASWVTLNGTDNTVALTLEVNMNTPLSIRSGYRSEAVVLGKALSKYFVDGYHKK